MGLILLNNFLKAVDDSILKMNKFSKIIFTYSVIISTLTFVAAVVSYVLAKKYWEYYIKLMTASDIMLQIFQLSVGAIIIAVIIDIVMKSKDT